EYQLAILNHAAKPAFLASFVYLIVVVKHRDHVLAEPGEIPMVVQCRIPKEREVLVRFGSTLYHGCKPSRNIFDPERRIQAGRVHHRPCVATPASHLAGKKEALLPETLCELVNGSAEDSRGLLAHVLHRIDAKAVDVGVGDPVFVTVDETTQCWRGRWVSRTPVHGQVQLLEIVEVSFPEFGIEVEVSYSTLAKEIVRGLQLSGPDSSVGPGRVERRRIRRIKSERRLAIPVAESLNLVRPPVPSWIG